MSTEITTLGVKVTQKGAGKVKKEINSIHTAGNKVKKLLGSLFVGGALISGAKRTITAFKAQEQAVAKLNASMASMNRTTPKLSQNLQDLASQIQRQGIIGDEALLEGASFLTTYKAISDDLLPRTIRIMSDFAAKMGGNTVQAANLLGKASMGLTGELSRLGITLSDEAKKTKNFKLILSEIEEQVQGMNKALAATDTGKLTQVSNAFGDLQEGIGKVLAEELAPIFVGLANSILGAKIELAGFNEEQLETVRNFNAMSVSALNVAKLIEAISKSKITLPKDTKGGLFENFGGMLESVSQSIMTWRKATSLFGGLNIFSGTKIPEVPEVPKKIRTEIETKLSPSELLREAENLDIRQRASMLKITSEVTKITDKLTKKKTQLEKITEAQINAEKLLGTQFKNSKITLEQYTEGLNIMKTEIQNYDDVIEKIAFDKKMEKMAQNMEDSITDSLMNMGQGLSSFKDLASSIFRDIAAEMVRVQISRPIAKFGSQFLGDMFGSMFGEPSGTVGSPVPIVDLRPPSGDGGGFTGFGSRSGGVDSKGGFPAILHPNETIIDHTKGQGVGGGNNITVHYSPQVNALDPRTAAVVIAENAPIVVGIIRQAFNRNGQSVAI